MVITFVTPATCFPKWREHVNCVGYPRLKTFDSDSSHFPEEKVMQDVYQQIEQDTKALIALSKHADSLTVSADAWTRGHGKHCRELATPYPSQVLQLDQTAQTAIGSNWNCNIKIKTRPLQPLKLNFCWSKNTYTHMAKND